MSFHVLSLTPFYPTQHDDAAGCFVKEPIQILRQSGVDMSVIAVKPFHRALRAPGKSSDWVRYITLPGNRGLSSAGMFLFARVLAKTRRLHNKKPLSVIHAHGALPCGHAAALLSRALGIPFVVTVHGLDAFSTNQVKGWAGESCRRISQYVYCSAACVVCVSEHVRECVQAGIPQAKCSVVYNGVDSELFSPFEADKEDAFRVLSVGNLIPTKGHELLIRSFAKLSAMYPAVVCEVVGEGPERRRLEALTRELGVAKKVRFLGRLNRRETAAAMRRCTVFALPSSYEGLGCVYLEAMSSGKPVIGCRGQGIEEVIRHGRNGLLLGTNEVSELYTAVSWLLNNRQVRERMGQAARSTIHSDFTLHHQAEKLSRIYVEVSS